MPDSTPNVNETEIAKQLALALIALYQPELLPGVGKASVALNAVLAGIALFRKSDPTAADWAAFDAALTAKIAAEEAKIEALKNNP